MGVCKMVAGKLCAQRTAENVKKRECKHVRKCVLFLVRRLPESVNLKDDC